MKTESQNLLHDFLIGLPTTKRNLDPDISQPMDYKRLIKVAISLIEESETMDRFNITSECENIGEEYTILLEHSDFETLFCEPILSEINNAKHVIETYLSIKQSI